MSEDQRFLSMLADAAMHDFQVQPHDAAIHEAVTAGLAAIVEIEDVNRRLGVNLNSGTAGTDLNKNNTYEHIIARHNRWLHALTGLVRRLA